MSEQKTIFLGYVSNQVALSHVRDFGLKNCAGLLCIKSFIESDLRTRGRFDVRCAVLDGGASDSAILKSMGETAPAVAGFSCFAFNFERTARFAKYLKRKSPETMIVFGGPEALDPARVLDAAPFADAVVCGEGESPMIGLLAGRKRVPHVSCGGDARRIDARPAVLRALDAAPPVFSTTDRELLYGEVYYQASRGCPGPCEHCTMGLYRPVRVRSMDAIEQDFGHIFASGRVSLLSLCDAATDANPSHFRSVLGVAARLNGNAAPISGYLYLATFDPAYARLMRDAGFRYARVCITPREAIAYQRKGRGGGLGARRFENMLRLADVPGVKVSVETSFIHPGLTFDDFHDMLDILGKHGLADSVEAVQCAALPGTRLMERAEKLGLKCTAGGLHRISSCATYTEAEVRRAGELFSAMKSAARRGRGQSGEKQGREIRK